LVERQPLRVSYRSRPAEPQPSGEGPRLDLKVIFTDLSKTSAALQTARTMARGLGARITLMVAQVVPYPLPLTAPDVPAKFTERIAESIAVDDTTVEIYLCRDRNEALRRALPPGSLVIVGARKRRWRPSWFLSWDHRLARVLREDGQRVLVISI
jgi:hypothetical protein